MGGMFRRSLFLMAAVMAAVPLWAQQVKVEILAPMMVAVGESFRVEYSVNAKPEGFKPPAITGFDVLAGPTVSNFESTTIVNGQVNKTASYAYTYVMKATAAGKFTIPPVEMTVDGKQYRSQPLNIEVIADGGAQQGQGGQRGSRPQGEPSAQQQGTVAADDILIVASVNRSEVYKGQPVKLTLKIYTRLPFSDARAAKLPGFNGFWRQELPADRYEWKRENYNNKVYDARILSEHLLYPQQSGTLRIDPFEMEVIAQIITRTQARSIIEDMMGGGQQVREVQRNLSTKPLSVRVKDFPAGAPASFGGAVGNFTMTADLSSRTIAANAAGTYTLKISGSGNLPLIPAPKPDFPGSFEIYNTKTTESLTNSVSGISGYRQFEFPFIARAEGVQTLGNFEFTYFNPETSRYVTLNAPAMELTVTPDEGGGAARPSGALVSGMNKEDIKVIGSDIRFINISSPGFSSGRFMLIGSVEYFLALLLIALVAAAAYVLVSRAVKQRRNVAALKGKRANKVALQRFNAAEKHKRDGDRRGFLNEMLRALWGYMGDRLNIPAANLTKDNIREELAKRNAPVQAVERYVDVISACEHAQYSPETTGQADDLYRSGVEAISEMESILK